MILGQKVEEELQGGRQEPLTASHWLGQLGNEAAPGLDAGMMNQYGLSAQQLGTFMPPGQSQPSITDLVNRIMKGISPGAGTTPPGVQETSTASTPAGQGAGTGVTPDQAGLLSALMAAQNAFYGGSQPTAQTSYAPPNGYLGGIYGGATEAYGAPSEAYGTTLATTGLPPPLHDGMPNRDDDEARWKRSTRAGGGGKKGKDNSKVPASQNTRSALCTFFAQGKYVLNLNI
jgi:hypothetical protein